jgi:opacity protein-like surface antigen
MSRICLVCIALAFSSPALAQDAADNFSGPLVGVETGLVQHYFSVIVTRPGSPDQTNSIKSYGVGGVAFAGYDVKISPRFIIGGEAAAHFGGKTASDQIAGFGTVGINPKIGYSVSARIGYAGSDKLLLFGRAGYGSHNYRDIGLENVGPFGRNNSFVLGLGAEYRIKPKFALRFDLRHLDGSRNEILVGIPVRF